MKYYWTIFIGGTLVILISALLIVYFAPDHGKKESIAKRYGWIDREFFDWNEPDTTITIHNGVSDTLIIIKK